MGGYLVQDMVLVVEKSYHYPVLADDVARVASVSPGDVWVDCTLGFAGHTKRLLDEGATVLGIDQDSEARRLTGETLASYGHQVRILAGNFGELSNVLAAEGVKEVDGILADIGVSSYQLDQSHRGFSFRRSGPIDMRMNTSEGETAEALLRRLSTADLADVLRRYGEEPFAMRITRAVHRWLETAQDPTTTELADCIATAIPAKARSKQRHHPATKTFQALRIVVNDELGALERLLESIPHHLAPGGRAIIISFHSLEDRMVKRSMNRWAGKGMNQAPRRGLPPPVSEPPKFELLTRKAITASEEECHQNPRSRSAKMRACRKLERVAA